MRTTKSHDTPRPQDTSRECLRRLREGSHHAAIDLIEALQREQDPRWYTLQCLLEQLTYKIAGCEHDPGRYATNVVTLWQQFTTWSVRWMEHPKSLEYSQNALRLVNRGAT